MARDIVSPKELAKELITVPQNKYGFDRVKKLHGNLALPSYVHGYTIAIQYMYDWFKKKFPKDFFVGGIYIDGKNVLDDYNRLNEFAMKNIIKGQNPRARMAPVVQYDYDREGIDLYTAPPEIFLKRSQFQDAFFKDYDRDLFLGFVPRVLRMDCAYKVRLNSRSHQLDVFNKMELDFRNGATQYEYISVDFHVPKHLVHDIADKAGFKIENGEVVDIIEFVQYLNRHSEIPFLFKLRAINQKPEYFIRIKDLYTHISVKDKLQLDDGESDGKLDFNYHIEMNATLDLPIPHYYAYYSAEELMSNVEAKESSDGCVAVYSINVFEIPKVDEHGWGQAAYTIYSADEGEQSFDISTIFKGDNPLSHAINHDLALGVSPWKFVNIKLYRDEDVSREVEFEFDWENKICNLKYPEHEGQIHIVVYFDREYINTLEIAENNLNRYRISK